MGRQHPDKSLENALHRIVKQRTLASISMRNVAFVLEPYGACFVVFAR